MKKALAEMRSPRLELIVSLHSGPYLLVNQLMTTMFVQQLLALPRSAKTLGCAYGQESPGWISLFELVTFFLLKIYRNINFFDKIDWSMNSRPQWAGDC